MDEVEIYKDALRRIAFKTLKRKMLKDVPPADKWWDSGDPFTLIWLLEDLGEAAKKALEEGEARAALAEEKKDEN